MSAVFFLLILGSIGLTKVIGCCYFVPGIAYVFSFCLISNINCQLDRKYISTSCQWISKGLFPLHRRVIQILAYKQAVKEVQCSITQPLSWRTLVNRTTRDTVGLFGSRQAKTILCQPGINNIVLIVLSKLIWQLGEAVIYLMTEFLWRQSILLQLEMCVRVWFLGRGGCQIFACISWTQWSTFRISAQRSFVAMCNFAFRGVTLIHS